MTKVLVRNNSTDEVQVLDDSEFIDVALTQMSEAALSVKGCTQSEELLNGLAVVLELMQEVLAKNNINPINVVTHATNLRNEFGSFSDKKATTKE